MNVHGYDVFNSLAVEQWACQIIGNLIDGVLEVLNHMDGDHTSEILALKVEKSSLRPFISLKSAQLLRGLMFESESFKQVFDNRTKNGIQLQDCWYTFAQEFKNYPIWGGETWIPSTDDCIRSRIRTCGVVKEEVKIDGTDMILYDVGGQRSERRKWMHMFDDITASIFVAAISEYDQNLFEDGSKNRLEEALDLFTECVNSTWLRDSRMILFLNKKDLFLKKFKEDKVPLNVSGLFPSAPLDDSNVEAAIHWMKQQFQARIHRRSDLGTQIPLVIHVTTATDASNIKTVFTAVKETILQRNLVNAGFSGNF
jgi:hypothetical protein